jgi:mRNA-degrading endonuclease HigB of HigAB toxin-antitoxin module
VRLVGTDKLAEFLAYSDSEEGEAVRALIHELRDRNWKDGEEMVEAFRNADASSLPTIVFRMQGGVVRALVDFRIGVVLVTGAEPLKDG